MEEYQQPIGEFEPKTKSDFLTILRTRDNDEEADLLLPSILINADFTEEDTIELLQAYLERESDHHGNNENEEKVLLEAFADYSRNAIDLLLRKFSYIIDKLDDQGNSITHHFVENEKQNYFGEEKVFGYFNYVTGYEPVRLLNTEKMESETTSFVEWLIEKGFDFDRQNNEGKSALLLCIEYNLQHILVVLLKHTREINSPNLHIQSLLCLFLEKNAEYRDNCRSDKRKETWYNTYVSRYATDIVKILLDKAIAELTPDIWNRSPLYKAIKWGGNTEIGELVINYFMKSKNDETKVLLELMKSCPWWNGSKTEYYLNVLRELTSNGADVNTKAENGTTPVYWAFYAKNLEAVNFMNGHGANFGVVTENDENLFHALAKKLDAFVEVKDSTQEALFDLLLKKDCCEISAKTKTDEETPLHLASTSGYLGIVRKLIEHGAEVDCKNVSGETPLHLAVHSHSEKVAEFLLVSGADVNSKDKNRLWPLHYAATSRGEPSMAPVLLKWGAYVNAKLIRGRRESPFSRAIRFDSWFEVREMLDYGGDINDDCVASAMRSQCITLEMRFYIIQHWFKLDIAKLPATTKYPDIVNRFNNENVRSKRLAEVEVMKKTLIDDRISIYSFLHMGFDHRRGYLNDEKVKNLVDSPELKTQFPEYAVVIRASYRETVMWKSLLEPAKRGWIKLTGIGLPGECLELIFAHLRNEDLVDIVEYDKYN